MGFTKALLAVAIAYVMGTLTALAQDPCPSGPFETDVDAIAAAMAAQPLKPLDWYATRAVPGAPDRERITDGAFSAGGGGLGNASDTSTSYDAKRYVIVNLIRDRPSSFFPPNAQPKPLKPSPHQATQKEADVTYITTVARPTPEDASEFACLANRLLVPKRPPPPPPTYEPPADPRAPIEVTITGHRRPKSCDQWMSDGAWSSFGVTTSRPEMNYDPDLSCVAVNDLERQMGEIMYAPIRDVMDQIDGSWQPPKVRSMAIDSADNLYLLIDSGSHHRPYIEVRKVTPAGNITRIRARIGEDFWGAALAVTTRGRVWVPESGRSGTVIRDLSPAPGPDAAQTSISFDTSYPDYHHAWFHAITADGNDNLYVTDGNTFKITPAGVVSLLSDWESDHRADDFPVFEPRFQLVAAGDGTLFVSDAFYDVIIKVTADGTTTILAGALHEAGAKDGRANKARFRAPKGLALDRAGNLYVADSGNHTVRRITPDGQVSTFAGKHGRRGTKDGPGSSARLDSPTSMAIDSTGTLYVADANDNLIRKISPTGVVSTVNAQQYMDAR